MNQRKSHCKGIYLIPCVHLCQVEPVHLEFLSLKYTSIHGSMKYFLSGLRFYFRLNNKFKPFWISITTLGSFLVLFNSLLLNSYCASGNYPLKIKLCTLFLAFCEEML